MSKLNSRIPEGTLDKKWTDFKSKVRLVNPANKRRLEIIVVGSGLAGGAAAASLAEMGKIRTGKVNCVYACELECCMYVSMQLRK